MKVTKVFLTITLTMLVSISALAQEFGFENATYEGGKFGLKDNNGKVVVPAIYSVIMLPSNEGLMSAQLNGKWGIIDKAGKEVFPFIYDAIGAFSDGLALAQLNGKWGLIDKTGKEVIPCIYDGVGLFSDGLATARLNDKSGFIDKTGKEVIPFVYDGVVPFSDGLAAVKLNGNWGVIDKTGKDILPFIYNEPLIFTEGLATVQLNGKWGFIDKTGKEVIPFIYDEVRPFSDGLARVTQDKQIKFINPTGKVVFILKKNYTWINDFIDGTAIVMLVGSSSNKFNPVSIEPTLAENITYFSNVADAAILRTIPQIGVIDKTGKEIIQMKSNQLIKRHTDDTFEVFKCTYKNGVTTIVSTGKFYDNTGKLIKGKIKTEWQW